MHLKLEHYLALEFHQLKGIANIFKIIAIVLSKSRTPQLSRTFVKFVTNATVKEIIYYTQLPAKCKRHWHAQKNGC